MSDWQPQIVRIEKIEHHSDADALDICTVLGDYPVITKRDEYQIGDIAGYIPIDSIVPDTQQFYFLCPRSYEKYEENGETKQRQVGNKYELGSVPEKYRIIKAKKIRGVYSQGMLVPVPKHSYHYDYNLGREIVEIGDSIESVLGLKKWEEPEEENLPGLKKKRADQASPPKGWAIPYYDIEGLRKYVSCLGAEEEIVLTEKIHGSNASFCFDGETFWVKSRNFYKKMDEDDMWCDVAIRYDLANKLTACPMHVFFGEIYGQVKGFRYDTEIVSGTLMPKIRFFDILNVKTMRYLDYDDRVNMIRLANLTPVPELYRGPFTNKSDIYSYAEGNSTLNPRHIREGCVINTLKERYESKLDGRLQLKLVGEGYNLQK